MNLLCISYAFPPISSPGALRVYHFAKYLARQENYKVDVLYCNNGYSSMVDRSQTWDIGNIRAMAVDDLINKNSFVKNKLSADKIKKNNLKKLLKVLVFPDRDITWFLNLLKANIKNKKYDYIFCSYPNITNLIAGYYFSKKFNVDLIVDMRDLWVQDSSFLKKNMFRRFLEKCIEKRILKHAKKILTVSQFNAEQLNNIYGEKVSVVYNGFDDDKFKDLLVEKKQQAHFCGRFRLVYAGSFYEGERKVDCLFQALNKLKLDGVINKNNFFFEIYGNKENYIADLIEQWHVNDIVEQKGLLGQKALFDEIYAAHTLLVVTRNQKISQGEMTTKFFEYIALGNPILCLSKSNFEIVKVIQGIESASYVDLDDAKGIESFLKKTLEDYYQQGAVKRRDIDYSFSRNSMSEVFKCLLET